MRTLTLAFVTLLIVSGCAPSRESRLAEIVPYRTYKAERDDMKTALRVFCEREGFVVHLSEDTFGKMLASRVDMTSRDEAARTIIMSIILSPGGAGLTKVDARISFADFQGTPTRTDEEMLVDYYHRLFDFLEGYF